MSALGGSWWPLWIMPKWLQTLSWFTINGWAMNGFNKVMVFDTEQGAYWAHVAYKRILKALDIDNPTNLEYYNLQQYAPTERLAIIGAAISGRDDISLVAIDGIRDLISSINDENQATDVTTQILKWCATRQIHVCCILHQNKNDFNARGHIGTELINKAESVISVTKEKDESVSTVKQEFCRDMDFRPFSFRIDDEGLPQLTEIAEAPRSTQGDRRREMFTFILKDKGKVRHAWLVDQYMEASGYKERAARNHIMNGLMEGYIFKDNQGSYSLIQDENNDETEQSVLPF